MGKREAILQATIDVVAKQGIADSPTILIAKEAGAAELTLFRLFRNKQGLLFQAYDEVIQRFRDTALYELKDVTGAEQKLVTLLKVFVVFARRYPNELAYFQQYINSAEGLLQRPDIKYERGEDISGYPLVAILDEGKKQGVFKDLPMTALMGLASAAMIMFLREERIRAIKHTEAEINLLIQAILQAVKA